jgi:hypothetical protein
VRQARRGRDSPLPRSWRGSNCKTKVKLEPAGEPTWSSPSRCRGSGAPPRHGRVARRPPRRASRIPRHIGPPERSSRARAGARQQDFAHVRERLSKTSLSLTGEQVYVSAVRTPLTRKRLIYADLRPPTSRKCVSAVVQRTTSSFVRRPGCDLREVLRQDLGPLWGLCFAASRLVERRRRPDSNRGPLHYER